MGLYCHASSEEKLSGLQNTIFYIVLDGLGDFVKVCKTTFLDVFAIMERWIEALVKAKKLGEATYT